MGRVALPRQLSGQDNYFAFGESIAEGNKIELRNWKFRRAMAIKHGNNV
jgi:hypothetical protein